MADRSPPLSRLLSTALPISLLNLCGLLLNTTDTAFLGHLGNDEFAASNLAVGMMGPWWMITLYASTAVNTLASEARGARRPMLAQTWMRIGILFCLPVALICAGGFMLTRPLLSLLTSEVRLLDLAGQFAGYSALWLLPAGLFGVMQNYLQSLDLLWPGLLISAIAVVLNALLNGFLIHGFPWFGLTHSHDTTTFSTDGSLAWDGLGFVGSPLATLCANMLKAGGIWICAFSSLCLCSSSARSNLNEQALLSEERSDDHIVASNIGGIVGARWLVILADRERGGDGSELSEAESISMSVAIAAEGTEESEASGIADCVQEAGITESVASSDITCSRVWKYTVLFVPTAVMVAVEECGFNVLTVFSARFQKADINAIAMLWQLWFGGWAFYIGLPLSAQAQVAAHLGARRPAAAKSVAQTAVAAGLCFQVAMVCCLVASRNFVFSIWTNDPVATKIAVEAVPIVVLAFAFSLMGYTLVYILQGAALPEAGMWAVAGGTWIVMVPLAYILCFPVGMGIAGIWWAVLTAEACKLLLLIPCYTHVDWDERSRAATSRQRGDATME